MSKRGIERARLEAERSNAELGQALERVKKALDGALDETLGRRRRAWNLVDQSLEGAGNNLLKLFDDRRASAWMSAFFAGCLFASWLALSRSRTEASPTAGISAQRDAASSPQTPFPRH